MNPSPVRAIPDSVSAHRSRSTADTAGWWESTFGTLRPHHGTRIMSERVGVLSRRGVLVGIAPDLLRILTDPGGQVARTRVTALVGLRCAS